MDTMEQVLPKNQELAGLSTYKNQPQADDGTHYTLYVFPFSLYSIMARFTIALGSRYHKAPRGLPDITYKLLNLHTDENLEEWYLTTVNPKGQVPAMYGERNAQPRLAKKTDSLDISKLFCQVYFPAMLPDEHKTTIDELLGKIHAIQGFSLSVKEPREEAKVELLDKGLEKLLARDDISTSYRRALEYKRGYYMQTLAYALRPDNVAQAKTRADELLQRLLVVFREHNGSGDENAVQWLFGSSAGATVLDAHATAFIARLDDAEQQHLVPATLLSYARKITALPAWEEVCHGRKTIWNIAYGRVDTLADF